MAEAPNPTKKGKIIDEALSVIANGQVFSGWQNIRITKNLESIANSFSVGLFDKFAGLQSQWPLKPGVDTRIVINRQRVLTGFIEKLDVRFDASNRGFSISGRSKAGDLVDCGHTGESEYKNISLLNLAQTLIKPFGLTVETSVEPKNIDKFAVKPGESVFEALDRAARLQGFFFVSTRNGNIRLTKAPENEARFRATDSLEQGVNLLNASAVFDNSQRFSQYIVKGQTSGEFDFFGESAAGAKGQARDAGISRHRPLELIAEAKADSGICETRAQWEATNRLAKAMRVTCSVRGWTQSDGKLWDVNQLTRIKSQFLGINRQMLINQVVHTAASDAPKLTALTLVDPDAYKTLPVVNEKKDMFADLGANFK